MKQEKSLLEQKYDIDNEYGRSFIKDFEKELAPYLHQKKTVMQKYEGKDVKNELINEEVYLLDIGAISFRDNECGYRVDKDLFSEAKIKMKQLRRLEERRKWARENVY